MMAQDHYWNTESSSYVLALEKKAVKRKKRLQRAERLITVGKPVLLLDFFFSFFNKKPTMLTLSEVTELYFANIYRGKKVQSSSV